MDEMTASSSQRLKKMDQIHHNSLLLNHLFAVFPVLHKIPDATAGIFRRKRHTWRRPPGGLLFVVSLHLCEKKKKKVINSCSQTSPLLKQRWEGRGGGEKQHPCFQLSHFLPCVALRTANAFRMTPRRSHACSTAARRRRERWPSGPA